MNDLSLAPGLAISPEFDLAPGQSVEAALRFDLSPGEYQFLSGYGGGVHQTRSLASNMISFNVDSAGRPHLIEGETASESVRTRRVGVVCGRVVLPDGTAAADAKVFLWAAPMAKSEPRSSNMAITTADGRFRIESVPEGHYALSAVRVSSHRVFAGASGDRSLADAEVLDLPSFPENCSLQLMIRAKPTYSVRGRTGAANPAAETRTARLILKTGDAYPFQTSAAIQADGRFEFRDVPAGDYQFFAGATGATVDVNADIDDVGIDIGWPGRTSEKTAEPDMSADFNEAMTVSELASINQAQCAYAKTYGKGFARNLDVLGTPPEWYHETADHAGLLGLLGTPFLTNEDATHFTQFGYQFTYSAGDSDATGSIASYTVSVRPTQFGKTGEQNFFTDESGVIRAKNADAPATKDDPVVNIQLQ